jgi:molybdopterin molybdotransferase
MVAQSEAGQRIAKLTPLPDALAAIDRLVRPVEPGEADIGAARGRVLAADVKATADAPIRALALRDGWAVQSAETIDAGSYAPALLSALPPRIDAGQALPAGADAVAPIDGVAIRGKQAEALVTVAPGDGVLPAGADAKAGTPLRTAGERLRITDQAVLSHAGISRVTVRAPRIRLVRARADLDIAAGYDWLAAMLAAQGASVIADDGGGDDLKAAFHHQSSDAILVLGGTGSGMNDRIVTALAQAGSVAFHGVGLIPGEAAAFGVVGARTVLVLPERFDATLASWLTLGRHWLKKLSDSTEEDRTFTAPLARKVTSTVGMAEVVPVLCRGGSAEPLATGYLSQAALARADGWILVPPESEGYPAGTPVAVKALP